MFDFKILKKVVEDSGFKQSFIAKKIHISEGYMSQILTGKATPKLNDYVEICKFLKIPFDKCINRKSAS